MEQLLQMDCFSSATSLDHRLDLPPLKVSLSVVDPLGLPLTTRVVSGKRARAAGDISSRAEMDTVALDKPIKDAPELWEEAIAEEGVVNRGERGIGHSRPPTQASHPAIQTRR
jgi:hypothetical protein